MNRLRHDRLKRRFALLAFLVTMAGLIGAVLTSAAGFRAMLAETAELKSLLTEAPRAMASRVQSRDLVDVIWDQLEAPYQWTQQSRSLFSSGWRINCTYCGGPLRRPDEALGCRWCKVWWGPETRSDYRERIRFCREFIDTADSVTLHRSAFEQLDRGAGKLVRVGPVAVNVTNRQEVAVISRAVEFTATPQSLCIPTGMITFRRGSNALTASISSHSFHINDHLSRRGSVKPIWLSLVMPQEVMRLFNMQIHDQLICATAVAFLNREIEEFNSYCVPDMGWSPTERRVSQVEYEPKQDKVHTFDQFGESFLILEREPDGRFKAIFDPPSHEVDFSRENRSNSWGNVAVVFFLDEDLFPPSTSP